MRIEASKYCPIYRPVRKIWWHRWFPRFAPKPVFAFFYVVNSNTYVCNPAVYKWLESKIKGK